MVVTVSNLRAEHRVDALGHRRRRPHGCRGSSTATIRTSGNGRTRSPPSDPDDDGGGETRARRVERLGARPVAVRTAAVAGAPARPRPGRRRRWRILRLERTARRRGRPARPGGLVGGADHRHLRRTPPPSGRSGSAARFAVRPGLTRARLYASALGVYTVACNGSPVGDDVLAPGWTSYRHRLRYQTFDVTEALQVGDNVLGMTVAEGWYRGRLGFRGGRRDTYGTDIGPIAQLELHYDDGSIDIVVTDRHWRAGARRAPLGEPVRRRDVRRQARRTGVVDTRLRRHRLGRRRTSWRRWPIGWWRRPGRRCAASRRCGRSPSSSRRPTSPSSTSARTSPGGSASRVRGEAGDEVTLRHAEVLDKGELATWLLRTAAATDTYVLAGDGVETYEPAFTIHGFRYASVDGLRRASSTPASIEAVVCHSDMAATGTFECSDERLNQLHENVRWSMRGNFVDVPTDCPATRRTPRLDRRHPGVRPDGGVPVRLLRRPRVVAGRPRRRTGRVRHRARLRAMGRPALPRGAGGGLGRRRRRRAVGALRAVRRRRGAAPAVRQHAGVGRPDRHARRRRPHLERGVPVRGLARPGRPATTTRGPPAPTPPSSPPPTTPTRRRLVAATAGVLGHDADRARYDELADTITAAFNAEFVTPTGRMASDAQTAYALALRFDLLPTEAQRIRAAGRLAELVRREDYCIGTGFVGTPLVCDALVDAGLVDDAYHLLLQTAVPVVAVPGHDGCDHRVGALGQPAAGRLDQPHRDDLVQPLRPRRHRRLPAPCRRRPGAGRARLPQAARPPSPRRRAHPCRRHAADPVRRRQRAVEPTRRPARRRRRRAHRQHGTRRAARRRRRRRRPRNAPLRRCRTALPRSILPGHPDPRLLLDELDESAADDPTS